MPRTPKGRLSIAAVVLGGVALAALARPRGGASASVSSSPAGPCDYQPGAGLAKTYEDLTNRIHQRILEVRKDLGTCIPATGTPCSVVLASALASSVNFGIPPDIATALAYRESRFGLYLETERIVKSLNQGRCTFASGTEIGPLQVKPAAFCQTGRDPRKLLSMDMTGRIWYAVQAGLAYLEWLKGQFPGLGWRELLQAYNVGPTAYRQGKRNASYACDIIARANTYTELKV
jgi:hypothetical protein